MASTTSSYIEEAAALANMAPRSLRSRDRGRQVYHVRTVDDDADAVSEDTDMVDMDEDASFRRPNPLSLRTMTSSSSTSSGDGRVMQHRMMRQVLTEQISVASRAPARATSTAASSSSSALVDSEAHDVDGEVCQAPPPPQCLDQLQYCMSPERETIIRQLGEPGGTMNCYGCRFIRDNEHVSPVDRSAIVAITNLVTRCASFDRVTVAIEISLIHRKHIVRDDVRVPEWRAIDVYDHYFTYYHARIDPQQSVDQSIRTVQMWQQELQDNGTYYLKPSADNTTMERHLDPKRVKDWILLDRHKMMLLKMDPSKSPINASCLTAMQGMSRSDGLSSRPVVGALPGRWTGGGGGNNAVPRP